MIHMITKILLVMHIRLLKIFPVKNSKINLDMLSIFFFTNSLSVDSISTKIKIHIVIRNSGLFFFLDHLHAMLRIHK